MRPRPVDPYIVLSLMPDLVGHDRRPSAFIVYLALWMRAEGRDRAVTLSLGALTDATGLSKRAVQEAVRRLVRRKLVLVERDSPTATPTYQVLRPWVRKRS